MLKINRESNQTPEMTFIIGEYNNKPFEMNFYLDDSYKINGSFTESEKVNLASEYIEYIEDNAMPF